MIPHWLTGLAGLAILWQPLWWLAGGRQRLTWISQATVALALTLLALGGGRPLTILNAVIWTCAATLHYSNSRRRRRRPPPPTKAWTTPPERAAR